MLWTKGFAAALALVVLLAAAGSSGAAAPLDASSFSGEWTPNGTAPAEVSGHPFTVASSTESAGRAASGANSVNYDVYCKSTSPGVGTATYLTLDYTWDGGGSMGGCSSGKTQGHAYFWGPSSVGYFHPATLKGDDVLTSAWGPQSGGTVNYLKFTSERPRAAFLTKIKYAKLVRAGSHIAVLTSISGAGEVRVTGQGTNCIGETAQGGTGRLHIRIVRIGGPSLVELDALSVAVVPAGGTYESCDTQELIRVPVEVKSSDPSEKDTCPVGSAGRLSLTDRSAKYGSDAVRLEIPRCGVNSTFSQKTAKKGSHVAVAVTFDEKGY